MHAAGTPRPSPAPRTPHAFPATLLRPLQVNTPDMDGKEPLAFVTVHTHVRIPNRTAWRHLLLNFVKMKSARISP